MKIEIGDKEYNVTCARTEEERIKGLQGVTELKMMRVCYSSLKNLRL